MSSDSVVSLDSFQHLVRARQSVRAYDQRPVEKEKLEQMVEAARLAPSASNGQPWHLIFVTEPRLKNQVAEATYSSLVSFNKFAPQAPVLIVVVLEKTRVITQIGAHLKKRDFSLIDIGIVAEHLCLQATELGLGTCMLGWFDEKRIQGLLAIPSGKRIGLVITLGYPAEGYRLRVKQRKKTEEMSSYNGYAP